MSERKQQILQTAVEMIADEGYGSLTMRALARASGMKLGALQYHFRTSNEMLQALVDYIAKSYRQSFDRLQDSFGEDSNKPGIREIVIFLLRDEPGDTIYGDKLWPQLWAMQQVEPLVSDLVEDIYAKYLAILEAALEAQGSSAPHAEAIYLLTLIEGGTIFMGSGRRWESEAKGFSDMVLEYVDNRPGKNA